MSDIALRTVGLGTMYRIGEREKHRTLRDTLMHAEPDDPSSASATRVPRRTPRRISGR